MAPFNTALTNANTAHKAKADASAAAASEITKLDAAIALKTTA
jgi:hypothetical protein